MREIGHFVGGKEVKGTSGRFGDVFNPNTGEIQARVAFASRAEAGHAIAVAQSAQPAWAATNPQRRARVLFRFVELIQREFDSLAKLLSSEHGKTLADSRGDIQRGLEVVEFACGIPHLLKGEFSEGAGPGIDLFSIRQPLGVVAGITPFNFPAMIPMWKFAPALACGNAFILKPSERDPSVPMRLAELLIEAGLPPGVLNVVNGDKEAVDTLLTHPQVKAIGFVGSSTIAEYVYATGCAAGKRVQCFGGAKNHMIVMPDADMDQAVDALIGAGYGSAGERCMAVSVAVPVGNKTADVLVEKLIPRVESLRIGPSASFRARLRQRRRHLHPRRRYRARLHEPRRGRHGRSQFRNTGAARLLHVRRLETVRLRRPQPARARFDPLLHEDEDRDRALALGSQGRGRVRDPNDAVTLESAGWAKALGTILRAFAHAVLNRRS
jgi:malonate-semialdehyde dehydrogenase (acetylating)/methylmalonate-semialdehyde dehydrogenase